MVEFSLIELYLAKRQKNDLIHMLVSQQKRDYDLLKTNTG